MKDKHGENNALGDSEVQDGNELQELEKEHSSIMEANNDFDDAVSRSSRARIEINSNFNCHDLCHYIVKGRNR